MHHFHLSNSFLTPRDWSLGRALQFLPNPSAAQGLSRITWHSTESRVRMAKKHISKKVHSWTVGADCPATLSVREHKGQEQHSSQQTHSAALQRSPFTGSHDQPCRYLHKNSSLRMPPSKEHTAQIKGKSSNASRIHSSKEAKLPPHQQAHPYVKLLVWIIQSNNSREKTLQPSKWLH